MDALLRAIWWVGPENHRWTVFEFGPQNPGAVSVGITHYWKRVLCRGPEDLPRAKSRALGKDTLCRGPATGALGKERPSTKRPLPRVRPSAKTGPRQIKSSLGKLGPLGHGGHFPSSFAEGHPLGHRQRFFFPVKPAFSAIFFKSLPRVLDQTLGKDFF